MRWLDRLHSAWRPGGRAENGAIVVNCDPDPRSTSFSARLCRAYLDGARAAGRPVQYCSLGEIAGKGCREGSAANHMMLVCPIMDDPPSLPDLFSRPCLPAVAPRTIRIVFLTEVPAFLQRGVLQHSPSMQKLRGFFPAARIRQDFIGNIGAAEPEQYLWWIATIREYGSKGI